MLKKDSLFVKNQGTLVTSLLMISEGAMQAARFENLVTVVLSIKYCEL